MPKKKHSESASEQADRFQKEVERLVAAGELNPTEADERFERAMRGIRRSTRPPSDDCGD